MRLPAALAPLRHPLFRLLWSANVVVSLGVWMQNTGAGWLMTTLSPNALSVSLVQAATVMPIFLLALPAGALADILDRRRFILTTQAWMLFAAALLALLTYAHLVDPAVLLAATFAIGAGSAMNNPAWGSVMAEAVPRRDLVQAVALNGVGFNLARAVGPALAGVILVIGGPALTFALNAVSYLAVVSALLTWHRRARRGSLPREKLVGAIRAGVRFTRYTPAMRAALVRSAAYFGPAAAPWAMLPLVVREHLHLGAGFFGLLLGLMGLGGVIAGLMLPQVRNHLDRGNTILVSTACSAAGMALLALTHHWFGAAIAMLVFGLGWVGASAVAQGAAQLASPPWVRSRALAIYQLASNGGLFIGSFIWGWLGTRIGLPATLLAASVSSITLGFMVRGFGLDQQESPVPGTGSAGVPAPEDVAPELGPLLGATRGRVLETQHYRIDPAEQSAFLSVMAEVRDVRGRTGAQAWQLYEDVAHPDHWLEVWSVESWTDHLRESSRMSQEDRAVLACAMAFQRDDPPPPSRYLAVAPHRLPEPRESRTAARLAAPPDGTILRP
jgi:MFS family permease